MGGFSRSTVSAAANQPVFSNSPFIFRGIGALIAVFQQTDNLN
jgi:hypothetical protein